MGFGIVLLLIGGFLAGGVVSVLGQARAATQQAQSRGGAARPGRYGTPSRRGPMIAAVLLAICAVLAFVAGVLRIV